MFKEIHRVNLAKSQCIFIFVPSLKIPYEIFQPKLIWNVYGQRLRVSYWIWYRIENILWGLTTFNLQNGSEIVSLTLSLFSKYMSLGFSKPLSNWFICKLLTLFESENERQKIEPLPIPLPRASRNFPDVETRNETFFHNWTSEIIPFIRFGMQMDGT